MYSDFSGRSLSTISTYASGSGDYFGLLHNGQVGITERRATRILQYFSDHWPLELEWPSDIPRPDPSPDAVCFSGARSATSHDPAPDPAPGAAARPTLSAAGHLTNVAAWARALGFNPQNVRNAIARYGEGGPKWGHMPRKGTEAYLIMEELFRVGDTRVALARMGYEANRLGRRLGL